MGHFSGDRNQEAAVRSNSPLVDYALRGLDRCWLPEFGRWSHIYHLDDRKQVNESVPPSDVFYTLNVLLGMARVPRVPSHIDLSGTFLRKCAPALQATCEQVCIRCRPVGSGRTWIGDSG